jgi:hypothetical protein
MLGEFRIVLPRTWVGNAWVTPKAAGAAIAFRIPAAAFLRSGWPDLDQAYPSGFRPLPPLGKTEGDAFTFIEALGLGADLFGLQPPPTVRDRMAAALSAC